MCVFVCVCACVRACMCDTPSPISYRMFASSLDVKPNEHGEYEVAKGVSASIFRAILVRGIIIKPY